MMIFTVPIGTVAGLSLNAASKYTEWVQKGCCFSLPFLLGLATLGPYLGRVNTVVCGRSVLSLSGLESTEGYVWGWH